MIFQYQALDKNGDTVASFVDAPSEATARQKIRSQGLYLVRLRKQELAIDMPTSTTGGGNILKSLADRVTTIINVRFSARQVGLFSRQLATLLKAGLPLPVAITGIVEQIDNAYFRHVVADIKEKIEEGSSLSSALQRHRSIFSDMYVNMVRVGENLGSLDQVIERLAEMEEKQNFLTAKIRSALWYPAFMMFFALSVVAFLMINVIPKISEIFAEQKRDMPLPTIIVVGISDFLAGFWWLLLIIIIFASYFFKRYAETPDGRRKFDEWKMSAPIFKNLYRKIIVFRFTQNLGVLLNNHVDIIKSFEIVKKIVGNVIVEEKIDESAKKIKEGASVAIALGKSDFLPKLVLGMIMAGEASDKLDTMLLNIGRVYETEIDLTVSGLTSLIEPLIIVIMGIAIGTIVMSVMLPIMNMNMMVQ